MYIMAPLFAFAVGHTVVNKINMEKEANNTEALQNMADTLDKQNKQAVALFKAEQEILNKIKDGNTSTEDIPLEELENNYVECGD